MRFRSCDLFSIQRRRAVSDAAQLLRAKIQAETQRELLPVHAAHARQHHWTMTSFLPPVFCAVCAKLCVSCLHMPRSSLFAVGIWRKRPSLPRCVVLSCPLHTSSNDVDCGLEIHRGCENSAPACLGITSVASLPTSSSPRFFSL